MQNLSGLILQQDLGKWKLTLERSNLKKNRRKSEWVCKGNDRILDNI